MSDCRQIARQTSLNGYSTCMDAIVVGYDGSEAAGRALARAAEVAEAFSARLVVVSVSKPARLQVPAPVLEPAGPVLVPGSVAGPVATGGTEPLPRVEPARLPEPEELARRWLEDARAKLVGRRLEAEYVAEVGDPADRLLELAEHRHADLIVVGSGDHGFLERLLGRSVDEVVSRRADRDVLLVH